MYLTKKSYYGGKWKKPGAHDAPHDMTISGKFVKKEKININRITSIEEELGQWRKANQIHNWFVKNVQDGKDDCKEYHVSREKLKELLDTVTKVLASCDLVDGEIANGYTIENGEKKHVIEAGKVIKDPSVAEDLLPTKSGFFFGLTSYDKYYVDDLKETQSLIEHVLAIENTSTEFYYQSSW